MISGGNIIPPRENWPIFPQREDYPSEGKSPLQIAFPFIGMPFFHTKWRVWGKGVFMAWGKNNDFAPRGKNPQATSCLKICLGNSPVIVFRLKSGAREPHQFWKKRSENLGWKNFWRPTNSARVAPRVALRIGLSHKLGRECHSENAPELRELLREWPFNSESVFFKIGVVPRFLIKISGNEFRVADTDLPGRRQLTEINRHLIRVAQTVFLVNRVFAPCQKGAILTKTANMTNLHFTTENKVFAPQTPKTTKMTKMAGVTQAKAWFRESRVCSSLT